jgi:hypothetical protein
MKCFAAAGLFIAIGLLGGCASHKDALMLAPVATASGTSPRSLATGSLVVYSAFDPHAHFNGFAYHAYYSDYKIFNATGELLRSVHNDSDMVLEGPVTVALSAGQFRIVARANGHGTITIPVVITAGQTTILHLEGGTSRRTISQLAPSELIRSPEGQIIGWMAGTPDQAQAK